MPVFEDFFQEVSTVNLEDHSPDIGTAWTTQSGVAVAAKVFVSVGSRLRLGSTTDSLITSDDLGDADCQVEFEIGQVQTNNDSYIVLRAQDNQNFIGARMAGTGGAGLRLCKVVAGTVTDLVSTQGAIGVKYKITAEGTTIKFFADAVQLGIDQSVSDFQTETLQGVKVGNSSTTDWLTYYSADVISGGGISVTGDTAAFDFTALAGTVDLTGEILVTGSTASFDYSAISGAIDLTGQLLVTGQTANFDYNAINGAVEFTGEISVTGETASFDYIALPGTIDLTGEIIVTGSTANFDYTGENGIIELGAVINVVGQTANFNVNGVNAEVSLTGEITIVGDTATFDYVAKSGIVVIGEGQKIGTVTAGFADSTIGVQYKQNTITVNFGE